MMRHDSHTDIPTADRDHRGKQAILSSTKTYCVAAAPTVQEYITREPEKPQPAANPRPNSTPNSVISLLEQVMWMLDTPIQLLGRPLPTHRRPHANPRPYRGKSHPPAQSPGKTLRPNEPTHRPCVIGNLPAEGTHTLSLQRRRSPKNPATLPASPAPTPKCAPEPPRLYNPPLP